MASTIKPQKPGSQHGKLRGPNPQTRSEDVEKLIPSEVPLPLPVAPVRVVELFLSSLPGHSQDADIWGFPKIGDPNIVP